MNTTAPERANSMIDRESTGYVLGAYASFTAAILLVFTITAWGIYLDFQASKKSLLQTEINRLRTHALRTVVRTQSHLEDSAEMTPNESLRMLGAADSWLRDNWRRFLFPDESRLNAMIVAPDGRILVHSRPEFEGRVLSVERRHDAAADLGDDVFDATDEILAGGIAGYDITLPISFANREVGTYHSVLNRVWFENKWSDLQSASLRRWGVAFGGIAGVIVFAGIALLHFSKRIDHLRTALSLGHTRQLAELGQLAGSLAHEVRNPLNTIRLNLHVIQRMFASQANPDPRTDVIFRETVGEMERVDGLLHTLLNYTRPDQPVVTDVDSAAELRSICDFLQPSLDRQDIACVVAPLPTGLRIAVDRSRFRQVVLNLVRNATEAVGPGGRIEIELRRDDASAVLTVRDSGPGVPSDSVDKIFDPFFTTKELGTGLGLTLVRRYVQEAGGSIALRSNSGAGAAFEIRIPAAASAKAVNPSTERLVNYVA